MTPEELAELLGVDAGVLSLEGEQVLPRDDTARGYAPEPLERLAERLDAEGDVADVLPGRGGIVQHLQWALGTFFALPATERERVEVVRGEFLELAEGELLVSGGDGPAVLRVLEAGAPKALYVLERGRAQVWSTIETVPLVESFVFDVPDLPELTGGLAGPADVEADFRALRFSDSSLDRLSAPGLLLRFWVPRGREDRLRLLADAATKGSPLLPTIRRWHASLSTGVRTAALSAATVEAHDVREMLSELATNADTDARLALATEVALRRDRLESIRRALRIAGTAQPLVGAISFLDDLAARHLTMLADAGVSNTRLRRALVSEPDAWWALISD